MFLAFYADNVYFTIRYSFGKYLCFFFCCKGYVEDIFQTYLCASKDDLKKAANALKEKTPAAMNTMLDKQSRAEAVKKREERKKMVVKNVPPTTPGNTHTQKYTQAHEVDECG